MTYQEFLKSVSIKMAGEQYKIKLVKSKPCGVCVTHKQNGNVAYVIVRSDTDNLLMLEVYNSRVAGSIEGCSRATILVDKNELAVEFVANMLLNLV